jgi:hypothetical protein
MKTKYFSLQLIIVILTASLTALAQNGNSTFEIFSENGDPFILIMNGIQQNTQAQTNVKAQNMAMSAYKIRIIFRDTQLGALNDQINLDYASHQTYAIKEKKISNLQKNLMSVGNNVALELALKTEGEAAAKQAQIENENSRFVIKMISHVPIISSNTPANQYTQATPPQTNKANTQVAATSVPAQQNTVVQQTNTSTGNNAHHNMHLVLICITAIINQAHPHPRNNKALTDRQTIGATCQQVKPRSRTNSKGHVKAQQSFNISYSLFASHPTTP